MKKLYILLAVSLLAVAGVSCVKESEQPSEISGPHFTLTVEVPCSNVRNLTKAEIPNGVQSLNENLVNSIYYYFFPEGDGEEATPSISGHFLGLSINGDKSEDATKTWKLPVSANVISNELFPSGTKKCRMFIVANPPAGLVPALEASDPTLGDLRELTFTSDLVGTQDNFVMVCDDLVEEESRTGDNAFTAVATLKRVANKITLKVRTINEYIDPDTGDDWRPALDGLTVEFYNGLNKANLDGDFSALSVGDDDYFIATSDFSDSFSYTYIEIAAEKVPSNITPTEATELPAAGEEADQYVKVDGKYYSLQKSSISETPLYTYPMTWDFADQYEPYLLFDLPWEWTYDDGGTSKTVIKHCYYKLTLSQKSMETNGWYYVTVDLKAVGSFYKVDPVQEYLYEDYIVLDWNNAFSGDNNNVDADIKDARYLVVSTTDYVLNNQNVLSIPFSSSHQCGFKVTACSHMSYASNTPAEVGSATAAQGWFHFNGSVLEFEHELNNTLGSGMDYTPYEITLYIYHNDQTGTVGSMDYQEKITITQYPSLYLVAERGGNTDNTANPYLFINNDRVSGGWMNVHTGNLASSGANSNPNMYVVNVSALDEFQLIDGSYATIGDPRTLDPVTISAAGGYMGTWNPAVAPARYWNYTTHSLTAAGTTRILQNYYPTDRSDANKSVIAPRFRTNSASGQTNNNSYTIEEATRRCAAYQQDGYPAGRWRLPTNAELEFITKLCALGVVPPFFGDTNNYWSATDLFYYNGGTNTVSLNNSATTKRFCRCVYDEWYWDIIDKAENNTHSTKNVFYWGDRAR